MQKGNVGNKENIIKQVSAIVLVLCVALLFFTTFNVVFAIKAFFLGAFGFTIYPILVFAGFFAFCLLRGRKFVYSPKYLVYLFLCFFFFVCILQVVFTLFSVDGLAYGQYLANCFNGLYTPGGVLFGVFSYPVAKLLHPVAGIVFFAIGLIISIYFVLSYLQGVKEQKFAEKQVRENKYKNFDKISNEIEEEGSASETEEEPDTQELRPIEKVDDKLVEEESIFIDDTEKQIAKEKLGLVEPSTNQNTIDASKYSSMATERLFGGYNENTSNDVWQNRANREVPQRFDTSVVKKENPLFEKNKEYLKTLYQVNTDSSNPIINAEDYEDYKEKMKTFEDKQQVYFKRDLDVNQTLLPSDKKPHQEEEKPKADFGIEPYKKIANDRGGFDNFESNFRVNNTNFEPVSPISQNNRFNIANDSRNNFGNNNFNEDRNNFNKTNSFTNSFERKEEKTYSSTNIEGLEDYVKPIREEPKRSPLNPNNFTAGDFVKKDFDDDDDEEKPFDTNKLSDGDVSSSLGNTVSLKPQPSNVYNLPKSFNSGDYKQLEIMGTQKEKKNSEPKFTYDSKYVRPPIDLLERYINEEDLTTDHQKNIEILERVLEEFKIPAKVEAVRRGSAVTRYELRMPIGIPVRKIHQHASDIALALAAPGEIRIETPIKGKSAVGIEVPNAKIDKVGFRDIIESSTFQDAKKPLTFALGKDIDGTIYCCDLASMPHLLVAGSTGSGKSVCLNALILSLIYRTSPEDLRLILVDPKRVEFAIFNNLPHLLMPKAITEPKKALNAFDWLVNEMERRYTLFQECYVKNIGEYNSQPEVIAKKMAKLPFIVLIVDEFADLVLTTNRKELEEKIMRLTQKARAAGIHVILATQRPNAEIITGSIKINLPSRIAFAVTSYIDSKVILDQPGAEKLLGRGDMLYSPQSSEPIRVQGCFVDTPEVKRVVDFVKEHNACFYDENVANAINSENGPNGGNGGGGAGAGEGGGEFDSLMPDALKLVIENGQATISMLQRRFAIGFSRAARIIDQMETAKFISSSDGSKPRSVYITMEDYEKLYGPQN